MLYIYNEDSKQYIDDNIVLSHNSIRDGKYHTLLTYTLVGNDIFDSIINALVYRHVHVCISRFIGHPMTLMIYILSSIINGSIVMRKESHFDNHMSNHTTIMSMISILFIHLVRDSSSLNRTFTRHKLYSQCMYLVALYIFFMVRCDDSEKRKFIDSKNAIYSSLLSSTILYILLFTRVRYNPSALRSML